REEGKKKPRVVSQGLRNSRQRRPKSSVVPRSYGNDDDDDVLGGEIGSNVSDTARGAKNQDDDHGLRTRYTIRFLAHSDGSGRSLGSLESTALSRAFPTAPRQPLAYPPPPLLPTVRSYRVRGKLNRARGT
ncbi:hypothetical protein ALC60_01362, partial [Trachymyrmex zeteki]